MSLRDDDELGSIRWTPDAFSAPKPSPSRFRFAAGVVSAVTVALLTLAGTLVSAALRSPAAPLTPIPVDMTPAPTVKQTHVEKTRTVKLRDPMSPVSGFSIISDQAAQTGLLDEEYVIGVELDGEARAYPTNAMGRPESELLNDTLAGRSIAVTFCVTCQSPLVFTRQIAGQKLTLFLNGELLADNMIMKDVETGTEWVQLTGEAIHGPLKGHRLEQLPAIWTDWKTWRNQHPGTTVPDLPSVVPNYRHHPLYSDFPPEKSFFSKIQWGLARGDKARSWPYAQLARQPIVNDSFLGQPILVVFNQHTSTPTAFDRRAGNVELSFQWQVDHLSDDQTGSAWDPITGLALQGPLKGRRLTPVPGVVALEWAWKRFHPGSETWSAGDAQKP